MIDDLVLPQIKMIKAEDHYACYEIAPIVAGFSRAFGSALRRVLLSSLPSAAITSVQIEGVQHEFQDIPHIKEDVPEIVYNLKKVHLRSYTDHTVQIELEACGEGTVTAGDIKGPSTVEIVNPEAHIATLDNEEARLLMKMTVDIGRGFVEASAQQIEERSIGVIPIDAVYSPVVHVNTTVEPIREGDLDKILLGITTDGTISPDEALRHAASLLRQQFQVLANYHSVQQALPKPASDALIPAYIYHAFITALPLPHRAVNSLKRSGIQKVGQILEMEEEDLLAIRNFGVKSLQELCEILQSKGFLPAGKRKGEV